MVVGCPSRIHDFLFWIHEDFQWRQAGVEDVEGGEDGSIHIVQDRDGDALAVDEVVCFFDVAAGGDTDNVHSAVIFVGESLPEWDLGEATVAVGGGVEDEEVVDVSCRIRESAFSIDVIEGKSIERLPDQCLFVGLLSFGIC